MPRQPWDERQAADSTQPANSTQATPEADKSNGGVDSDQGAKEKTSLRGRKWPAIDPRDGKRFEVLIPHHRIQWAHRCGIGAIYEMAEIVPSVLLEPQRIFEGLRIDDDEDRVSESDGWLGYSASRPHGFHYETGEQIKKHERVLLVFVNKDLTAYNWRWEAEDPDEPGAPTGWRKRFKRKVLG